ncbi:TniQ family protein [Aliirhizobium cellulosilyticum]|nr:TniQ family protein [Rhizobium cellulosilyticum]
MPTTPLHFPRVVSPMDDEVPASYLARLAWTNGFEDIRQFARVIGIDGDIRRFSEHDANMLSDKTGHCLDRLRRYTVASFVFISFGESIVRRTQLNNKGIRFCAECLQDARKDGSALHIRGPWQWRLITHCPIHGATLSVALQDPRRLSSFDSLLRADAATIPSGNSYPRASDQYFYDRLSHPPSSAFLDAFPVYLAADLCVLLGRCLQMQEMKENGLRRYTEREFQRGFDIAHKGESNVWSFLAEHVRVVCKRVTHPRLIYSPFLTWWSSNKGDPRAASVMSFVQRHAETHVALEPGDAFVWPVAERRYHSIKSACQEHGLSENEVREVLARVFVEQDEPHFFDRLEFERSLATPSASQKRASANEILSLDAARRKLGVTSKAMLNLTASQLISTVELKNMSLWKGRTRRGIRMRELDRFSREYVSLDQLAAQHRISRTEMHDKLRKSGIEPALPTRSSMALLFRRRDLKTAGIN